MVVFLLGWPGCCREHDILGDIRAGAGDMEAEDGVFSVLCIQQAAVQGGGEHVASVLDADALADPVRSTDPAGVEQPACDTVALHLTGEHVGVKDRGGAP